MPKKSQINKYSHKCKAEANQVKNGVVVETRGVGFEQSGIGFEPASGNATRSGLLLCIC